jgi:hypothetical protein
MRIKYTRQQLICLVKDKVEVLKINKYSKYLNSIGEFKCKKCGHIWVNKFQKIMSGQSACSNCRYDKKRLAACNIQKTLEAKKIKPLFNIENYKNNRITYNFECKICHNVFSNSVGNIISQDNGCPVCSHRKKISNDEKYNELKRNNITLIKSSGNVKGHMTCKCDVCQHIWHPTFDSIRNKKSGCPNCLFKNERICSDILKEMGIIAHKKRIQNPFYNKHNTRRFFIVDFYFTYKGKEIIMEYNGRQHYEPVNFSGKESSKEINKRLVIQKNRDIDLEKTCRNKKIMYIAIDGRKHFGRDSIKNIITTILGEI